MRASDTPVHETNRTIFLRINLQVCKHLLLIYNIEMFEENEIKKIQHLQKI